MRLTVSPFISRLFGAIGMCSVAVFVLTERFAPPEPVLERFNLSDLAFGFMAVVAVFNMVTTSRDTPDQGPVDRSIIGRILLGLLFFVAVACMIILIFFRKQVPPFGIDADLFLIGCTAALLVSSGLLLVLPAGRARKI